MTYCIAFKLANQLSRSNEQGNLDELSMLVAVLECILEWYMRASINKAVNLNECYPLVVNACYVWISECLSMYVGS